MEYLKKIDVKMMMKSNGCLRLSSESGWIPNITKMSMMPIFEVCLFSSVARIVRQ